MSEVKNILLVGVGGQGTILASKILTSGLIKAGYDVKMSEIHGMSQRGGSVVTYIKYGKKVYSPVIEKGQADLIISFEALEAAYTALSAAAEALANNISSELLAEDIRIAIHHIGEITGGTISSDSVLHRIFSSFCIGK